MKKKLTKPVLGIMDKKPRGLNTTAQMTPKQIKDIEQRYQIVCLRRDGFSVQEIAETLGVSTVLVFAQLRKALAVSIMETNETTEESRQLQLERLDQLLKTYTQFATQWHKEKRVDLFTKAEIIVECPPDPKYANLILNIEMRRAKLLALDVPETKKLDVTGVREYVGIDIDDV